MPTRDASLSEIETALRRIPGILLEDWVQRHGTEASKDGAELLRRIATTEQTDHRYGHPHPGPDSVG
jgi:hypothetical protein